MPKDLSVAAISFRLLAIAWSVIVVPPATALIFVAATGGGRWFAVACLLSGIAPLVGSSAWTKGGRAWKRAFCVISAALAILWGFTLWRTLSAVVRSDAAFQSVYASGSPRLGRLASSNLLPEVDQLMLGFTLMPLFDPLFSQRQSAELKRWTADIYREMDADPEWRDAGSALSYAYREAFGLRAAAGHTYVFVPRGLDRSRPQPALVFLHGSGGNFKGYCWVLAQLAERLQCVVIAPSDGFGYWRRSSCVAIVRAAMEEAQKIVALDQDAMHLLGVSNGGMGVCRIADGGTLSFRSHVLVSPVLDFETASALASDQPRADRAFLFVHGRRDDRVPLPYVESGAAHLRRNGARVEAAIIDDANHFLFFSHRVQLVALLEAWIRRGESMP